MNSNVSGTGDDVDDVKKIRSWAPVVPCSKMIILCNSGSYSITRESACNVCVMMDITVLLRHHDVIHV